VLSFVYLGIYWNNHHHMLHLTTRANGAILWANLHLLFWLSLIPFTTGWMGENHGAPVPTAIYGVDLLMAGLAFWILQGRILALNHEVETHAGQKVVMATALIDSPPDDLLPGSVARCKIECRPLTAAEHGKIFLHTIAASVDLGGSF